MYSFIDIEQMRYYSYVIGFDSYLEYVNITVLVLTTIC
jgi:hypothetical protein